MAKDSTILVHRPSAPEREGYPQDAPITRENIQDTLLTVEVPGWVKEALASEDIIPTLQAVKDGREELMEAHPDMPRFVEALGRKHLFDVSVHGLFKIEDDEALDVEGYGIVKFRRDETGYTLVTTKDGKTTERSIAEVLPNLDDYRPQFDKPTGLFADRLIRAKMLRELQGTVDHNEESARFWSAWLQALEEKAGFGHTAARAYLQGEYHMSQVEGLYSDRGGETVFRLEVRDTKEGDYQYLVGSEINVWTGEPGRPCEFIAPYMCERVRPGHYRLGYRNDEMGYRPGGTAHIFDVEARYGASQANVWDVDCSDIMPKWSEDTDLERGIADDKQAWEMFREEALKRIEEAKKVAVCIPASELYYLEETLGGRFVDAERSPEPCLRSLNRLKGLKDGEVPEQHVAMSPRQVSLLRDTFNDMVILRECKKQIAQLSNTLDGQGKIRQVREITGNLAVAEKEWMKYRRQLSSWLELIKHRNGPLPPRVSFGAWEEAVRQLVELSGSSTASAESVPA